mmetsp:Transcript_113774/g.328533  ORF Transcript_113774/g.328533 Transcript_113774/m.328533 type:complete len:382 (+) Transcript_113774:301-1446(+)
MAEVSKGLEFFSLGQVHGKDGFQSLLQIIHVHLGHERVGSSGQDGTSTQPDLVALGTVTDKGKLGHVRTSTSIGASSHSNQDFFVSQSHLVHDATNTFQVAWDDTLGFSLGQSTKRKSGTGHGETVQRIHFLDGLDSVFGEDSFKGGLVLRINVTEDDGLSRAQNHGKIELVGNDSQGSLKTEVSFILHTTIVHMKSIEELAVSLFPPAHPVHVLPLLHWSPGLDLLSKVRFDQSTEVINSQSVDQILHTSVGTNITVSVITLGSDNRLHEFHDVFLGDKSHVIGRTSKGIFLVVSAAHTTSDHDIETFQFTSLVGNDDATNIVGVNVQRVVSRDGNTNLELARQVTITVDRFDRVRKDDTASTIVLHGFIDVELFNFLAP